MTSDFVWGASGPQASDWLSLALKRGLVLASSSPRRAGLLTLLGIPFEVRPSNIVEDESESDPATRAERLAAEKASAIAKRHGRGLILGADTQWCQSISGPAVRRDETRGQPSLHTRKS